MRSVVGDFGRAATTPCVTLPTWRKQTALTAGKANSPSTAAPLVLTGEYDISTVPGSQLVMDSDPSAPSTSGTVSPTPRRTPKTPPTRGIKAYVRTLLAKYGLGTVYVYFAFSSFASTAGLGLTWIAYYHKTSLSPLGPGQWPKFLTFYAGLWTLQQLSRPAKLAVAIAMAPAADRLLNSLSHWLRWSKSFLVVVLLVVQAVLSVALLAVIVSLCGGIPPQLRELFSAPLVPMHPAPL